jgi:hypothetical protein
MFRMIAAAVLLSSAGLALASDVSYDLRQRSEKAAPAPSDAGAKNDAPRPAGTCGCQHARS